MKKLFKYIIKLLFVIILPLVMCITAVTLMVQSPKTDLIVNDFPLFSVLVGILLLLSLINAVFYATVMSKTRLLPDIDFEIIPVMGFAVGYEYNRLKPVVLILLPFIAIEISVSKKYKK